MSAPVLRAVGDTDERVAPPSNLRELARRPRRDEDEA